MEKAWPGTWLEVREVQAGQADVRREKDEEKELPHSRAQPGGPWHPQSPRRVSRRQRGAEEHPAPCSRVRQGLSTAPLLPQDSSIPAESSPRAGLPPPQELGACRSRAQEPFEPPSGKGDSEEDAGGGTAAPWWSSQALGEKDCSRSAPPAPASLLQVRGEKQLRGQGLTLSPGGRAQPQHPR